MRYRRGTVRCPETASLPADNVDPWRSLPRLAAVIERQRRELVLARADAQAAEVAAMARGVLMERQGLSPVAAIRQLADMAAAAGIPVTEMAAAVLRQEPPSAPGRVSAPPDRRGRPDSADQAGPGSGSARGSGLSPGSGWTRPTSRSRWRRSPAPGTASSWSARWPASWTEVRGGGGRGLAARRRRRARAARPGRPRRHRLEPLAAAAAAVRLPGAAGGGRRRRPVVGGRAAAVRPGGRRGALGTERGPRGARRSATGRASSSAWPRPGGEGRDGSSTPTPGTCWRRWWPDSPTCSASASATATSGR